jgi:glycosyltransferase involved in cell wall biosynthesis
MRLGGGVRVKVLEALGAGKAVVATRLGADGIEAPEGVAILLADSAAAFASSVSALLGDERRRGTLASAAYAWARQRQTRDTTATRYDRLYAELLNSRRARTGDPEERRCADEPADGDDVPTTS